MNTTDEFSTPPPGESGPPATEAGPSPEEKPFRPSPRVWRISAGLFLLTCASTFFVGMTNYPQFPPEIDPKTVVEQLMNGGPQRDLIIRSFLWSGFQYSGALMSILLFHEFGHYLQARRYGVPAIPPLFIPMPLPPFGTMGAVIVQSPHHADRKAMFDIAISGPLAGLCLALPIAWWGILHSQIAVFDPTKPGIQFGHPLILEWMVRAVHGPLAENEGLMANPLAMAGWIGIFITALNLAPVGQLDGGHILYCLIGRKAHLVAVSFVVLVVAYMAWSQYWTFSVMIILMVMMGLRHPPTTNDNVPLGPARILLGWLTLAFLLIGIHPRPIEEYEPESPAAAQTANPPESALDYHRCVVTS